MIAHSGVKGMKWKEKKSPEALSPERQTFNEIMLGQYKGPLTPEQQAKFVKERFDLEQKVGSGKTSGGNTMYSMSNDQIKEFLANAGTMKKKLSDTDKKKRAVAKKKVYDLLGNPVKKVKNVG